MYLLIRKKHLQKAFFAKIKIDNRKWLFVIRKTLVRVFLILKIFRKGKKHWFRNFPNFFHFNDPADGMFLNVFTNRLQRRIRLCKTDFFLYQYRHILKRKITCIITYAGFSATNSHLRWSVLILSKNALSKCCLK